MHPELAVHLDEERVERERLESVILHEGRPLGRLHREQFRLELDRDGGEVGLLSEIAFGNVRQRKERLLGVEGEAFEALLVLRRQLLERLRVAAGDRLEERLHHGQLLEKLVPVRERSFRVGFQLLDPLLHDVDVRQDELALDRVELAADVLGLVAFQDREKAVRLADHGELAGVGVLVRAFERDRRRIDDLERRGDELLLRAFDLVHAEEARVDDPHGRGDRLPGRGHGAGILGARQGAEEGGLAGAADAHEAQAGGDRSVRHQGFAGSGVFFGRATIHETTNPIS